MTALLIAAVSSFAFAVGYFIARALHVSKAVKAIVSTAGLASQIGMKQAHVFMLNAAQDPAVVGAIAEETNFKPEDVEEILTKFAVGFGVGAPPEDAVAVHRVDLSEATSS